MSAVLARGVNANKGEPFKRDAETDDADHDVTVTWYQPGGAYGACGSINQNSDFVAALSPSEYAGGANCWRRIGVQCTS